MTNIKKSDIISTYRKILDPMGYTVVLKSTGRKQSWWAPKPEDKEKYAKMSSAELESELSDLRSEETRLRAWMKDIKFKMIDFLNKEGPNSLTSGFYSGTLNNQHIVGKSSVRMDSQKLKDVLNLSNYLAELQKKVVSKELVEKAKKEISSIEDIYIEKESGPASLIIKLE